MTLREQIALAKRQAKALDGRRVAFHGYECELVCGHYLEGRLAIRLVEAETGEPIAVATVNVPEEPLSDGETIIKSHTENAGMVEALEAAGIVERTGRTVRCGFVDAQVCRVLTPNNTTETGE